MEVSPGPETSANQYPVHLGTWTNWSRGPVLGATLTMRIGDADLVIAFTAFFIAFVSTRFWRILCFAFHRLYSTSNPQDSIYHQRQAILRNALSPEDGIRLLLQLLWSGRYLDLQRRFRPFPAAIIAILCVSAFTFAGGFSARISTAIGDEVLIKSMNCGYVKQNGSYSNPEGYDVGPPYDAERITNAANYAHQCYSTDNAGLLDCRRFVSKRLVAAEIDAGAACPFDDKICRNKTSNLRIDSGFIDSHIDLGLNMPANQRILWRNVLHCAPLVTAEFARQGTDNITRYYYGSSVNDTGPTDYMYAARSVESQYTEDDTVSFSIYHNYNLDIASVHVKGQRIDLETSHFKPIDLITRNDADMYIIFLSGNGVLHTKTSDDDWYRVDPNASWTSFSGADIESMESRPLYTHQEPASPLGCIDQYQFCSTAFQGSDACGPLSSKRDAMAGIASRFDSSFANLTDDVPSTETEARFIYFMDSFFGTDRSIAGAVVKLGPSSLFSQRHLFSGMQGPIAPDQWKLDVSHWWNISKAAMQGAFLDMAYGPSDRDTLQAHINFTSPELQVLCNNQKIRSTEYKSFSLFGLYFTLITGLLITLISYVLEPISTFLYKKMGCSQYAHLEWTTNATLQLQRLAHEEIGLGTWSNATGSIPATKANEFLGCLDLENPRHPVLTRPAPADDDVNVKSLGIGKDPAQGVMTGATKADETTTSIVGYSDSQESSPTVSKHEVINGQSPVSYYSIATLQGSARSDGVSI